MTYDELRELIWTVLPNASIDLDDGRVVIPDTSFEVVDDDAEEMNDYIVADRYDDSADSARYVIAGTADSDDGTLYWSNEDGWGFLGTATTFSTAESLRVNLPADPDARWMRLP